MYNLIWSDFYKLRKSSAVKVVFLITAICAVLMSIITNFIALGKLNITMAGIGFLFSDVNTKSILGAVIAGIFICGDFDNKTIHDAVSMGYSRAIIIVSKAVVFSLSIVVILLPYAIVTCFDLFSGNKFNVGSNSIGFLYIITKYCGTVISSGEVLKFIIIIFTIMVVYAAQLSICIPVAFTLKKPVFVVAIYYGITIVFAQIPSIAGKYEIFDKICNLTPFGSNYCFLALNTGTEALIKVIVVSLIFIIIMVLITYSVFRKKEIK